MIDDLYAKELASELFRLVSDRAGWTATLFRPSTIGLMEELAVAGVQTANGILSGSSFDDLKAQVRTQVLADPGLGSMQVRGPLLAQFPRDSKEFVALSFKYKAWVSSIPSYKERYVQRWRAELQDEKYQEANAPLFGGGATPYDAACFLASHLLHLGVSRSYLARWLDYRMLYSQKSYSLDDLVADIEALVAKGAGPFRILVALSRPPHDDIRSLQNWLPARSVREWLSQRQLDGPRQLHGGILYETEQWDLDSALLNVSRALRRLRQRTILKTGKAPVFNSKAWIDGVRTAQNLPEVSQIGEVLAPAYDFGGDAQVEAVTSEDRLEVAIDLLQAALSEPGPSAVGILWAALEALLAAPGDPDRIQVCKRAADIALVAHIRGSIQVSIGVLISRCSDETLAQRILGFDQRERLVELEESIRRGDHQSIRHRSTRLALSHVRSMLDVDALRALRAELEQNLRTLYRHRNLILHGGITDAPLLNSIFISAPPLVTAIINRYARSVQDGAHDPHLFAFDMYARVEKYLADPRSAIECFF